MATRKKRRRSKRGNWLVVSYFNDRISWCRWVRTWAGVQMSKRNAERYVRLGRNREEDTRARVIVLDIEKLSRFAVVNASGETMEETGISVMVKRLVTLMDEENEYGGKTI